MLLVVWLLVYTFIWLQTPDGLRLFLIICYSIIIVIIICINKVENYENQNIYLNLTLHLSFYSIIGQ